MQKTVKRIGIIGAAALILLIAVFLYFHETEPQGRPGADADAVARKMEAAVNKAAWDSTRYVQWTFGDSRHFLWDKQEDMVQVRWGDNQVLLHTKTQEGRAWSVGVEQEGDSAKKMLEKAWSIFCNDSFWLNPVVKAFDPGTQRSLVPLEEGGTGLKVTYTTGGVTPGDSYLWILDENYRPLAWKMWVSIVPVGGLEFSWENWDTLSTGAIVSTVRKKEGIELKMNSVAGAMSLSELGISRDPFSDL